MTAGTTRVTLALLAVCLLGGCLTFGRSKGGDGSSSWVVHAGNLGVVAGSDSTRSDGSLLGAVSGGASTGRTTGMVEADREGFVNVGGEGGVTVRGTVDYSTPIARVGDWITSVFRIEAVRRSVGEAFMTLRGGTAERQSTDRFKARESSRVKLKETRLP